MAAGYTVSDLYNVNPDKFGQLNNFVTYADNIGTKQHQRYNGPLFNVSVRPRTGLTFQGGINTGQTVTDNCEVRSQLPEVNSLNPYWHNSPWFIT